MRRLAPSLLEIGRLLGRAVAAWWNDNVLRLGASVAYYTLFAIAPILLIAIAVAGAVFGDEAVRGEIVGQIDGLVGREGGEAVQALLEGARSREGNLLAAAIGTVTSVLAACGVFLELQSALNTIWRVEPAPAAGVLRSFLLSRAQSFGLVLALGFLLLVSLAVSAALAGAGVVAVGPRPRHSGRGVGVQLADLGGGDCGAVRAAVQGAARRRADLARRRRRRPRHRGALHRRQAA